jgi:hypothetical protein
LEKKRKKKKKTLVLCSFTKKMKKINDTFSVAKLMIAQEIVFFSLPTLRYKKLGKISNN